MDKITLTGLEIFAHHGVFDFEKENGQTFILDCSCTLDTRPAGKTDNLTLSLDYGALATRLTALFQEKTFDLIEAAAEYCATALLREYPLVRSLSLTVKKPSAPVDLPLAYPAVSITRSWRPAVLALGSNIGDRATALDQAIEALTAHPDIRVQKTSDWIETAPWGNTDQPPFLNGATLIETLLSPQELLQTIHTIEAAQGRQRLVHWGPRTLDIDIIYYADLLLDQPDLTIPHPLSLQRAFAMDPVKSIVPYWVDPRYGKTVSALWPPQQQ